MTGTGKRPGGTSGLLRNELRGPKTRRCAPGRARGRIGLVGSGRSLSYRQHQLKPLSRHHRAPRWPETLLLGLLGFSLPGAATESRAPAPGLPAAVVRGVDFTRDVEPILAARCVRCHGAEKRRGGLRLDRRADALTGGDSHAPAIVPGDGAASPLIRFVAGLDPDMLMPPQGDRLSAEEIGMLRAWIDQGAMWPDDESAATEEAPPKHWSFQPVVRPPAPATQRTDWGRNPIDAFVLAPLEEEGLEPSPEASPPTLMRRVTFDVTGLPPTPEEVEAFAGASGGDSYPELVERLLASPHYGERWARHWLDVVRYAETHGFEMNQPRPNAWPYRDYVIRAFNEDKPYDQFVREQLVGDALDADAATGFLVAGPWDQVKSPDEVLTRNQRADELHDMINTTGTTFLGLTLGCARCHEHKFDPIPQRDYYALKAVFEGVQHGERPLRREDSEARRREAAAEREALGEIDRALAAFIPTAFDGETLLIDEEGPEAIGSPARVEALIPPTARGSYPAGTERGEKDDAGAADRLPNFTSGYSAWRDVAGRDVLAWVPGVSGRFDVFLSWGCGWNTHATDAEYWLDADGDLATREDQVRLAVVDQQRFADGSGEVPNRPLWSGFRSAGRHEFTPASRIVLRGGSTAAYVSADVLALQTAPRADEAPTHDEPRLRPPVNARENTERFDPVEATRLRFEILATTGGEPCLDELEVFTSGDHPRNVALAPAGTLTTASGTFANNPLHRLEHLNDGQYGNSRSWISNEPGRGWVELGFAERVRLDRVVWGRDREEKFRDRLATDYRILVETRSGEWRTVASSADRAPYREGRLANAPALLAASGDPAARMEIERLTGARGEHAARLRALTTEPMGYIGTFGAPGETRRWHRGDPMQPRESVQPGTLSRLAFGAPFDAQGDGELARRKALATWIVDPRNPLTARVMVNRIWQHHFGEGLVRTPSDFGANGARPTHPGLLDWLAAEFVQHGWSVKHLHRLILNSATYRQASAARPEALARDAGCRWLWRFPPQRLEAEPLRDAILAVSGNLDLRPGGPGWSPFVPNDNYVRVYVPRDEFGPDEWRRMIYATPVRQRPDGVFGVFDCPDGGQTAPRRTRSTTPLQAFNLLNSRFMVDQSERFAERLAKETEGGTVSEVDRAFRLAFGRAPTDGEAEASAALVREHGLALFCRALFNANEFIHVY
ncbi:MAG: PSD1 domain-containing protein [Verrucomicrobiales bacterium]|nr:PSD1 domain-containing protein [Verrucomicrobiales bacterium]